MCNPNNDLIVGYENSLEKIKQETINEGKQSEKISDCTYSEGSTFREWWMKGFISVQGIVQRS